MINFFKIFLVFLIIVNGFKEKHRNKSRKMEAKFSIFLSSLVGKWKGHAVRTPIGKISYNLNFKILEKNKIKGTSYTNGQAVHTWIFQSGIESQLTLDFHSTFGDSWARGLSVTEVDKDKGYLFSNGKPSHLKVWVNLTVEDEIQFEIFLWIKPHVSIVVTKI